jgi:hypothetical protein
MRLRPRLLVPANGTRPSGEVVVPRTLLRTAPQEPCSRRVEAEPARRRVGGVEAPSGGGLTCLLWRAALIRVRAEHAAVAAPRPQRRAATVAAIEPLARVCQHRFGTPVTALWTSEYRLQNDSHCETVAPPPSSAPCLCKRTSGAVRKDSSDGGRTHGRSCRLPTKSFNRCSSRCETCIATRMRSRVRARGSMRTSALV